MRRFGEEARLAAIILAASLLLALVTPSQVTGEQTRVVGSATLPMALALAIAALAFFQLVLALWTPQPQQPSDLGEAPARWPVWVLALGLFLYVALLPWLGFYLATTVLVAGLAWLFGERRAPVLLGLALTVPAALLLFFERFMIILLPSAPWI